MSHVNFDTNTLIPSGDDPVVTGFPASPLLTPAFTPQRCNYSGQSARLGGVAFSGAAPCSPRLSAAAIAFPPSEFGSVTAGMRPKLHQSPQSKGPQDPSSLNPWHRQRSFVTRKISAVRHANPSTYTEMFVEPVLQYFVASLCDLRVDPDERRPLGLRYFKTPEVQKVVSKLQKSKFPAIPKATDPNVVVSVLKEILSDFPGGIFKDEGEEFISIRLTSSLEIVLTYVNTLIQDLPCFLRQFTYLVCRCLKNLVHQTAPETAATTDSYTDMLLLFTPILFPSSVGDVSRFLRATRITLVLVDLCDTVFKPHLSSSWDPAESDEDFFRHVVLNLTHLSNWFDKSESSSADEADDATSDYGSLEALEEVPGLNRRRSKPTTTTTSSPLSDDLRRLVAPSPLLAVNNSIDSRRGSCHAFSAPRERKSRVTNCLLGKTETQNI
ncbi:hypothetical protein L596_007926 [Steinernema carpocapsae]|uniref:Rho-GAP domain-containing protein n=1 Tax=Steinernema carpocapsae TaxID=34508 RepID=A0A4U5PBW9_STECR|nr:hypothetical protein L596_007926 [Steinernema carpocapsae]